MEGDVSRDRLGCAELGLTRAACASIARLRRDDLARIATPVLMLASRDDAVIDVRALERAARRLPAAELRLLAGRGHELLREADAIRLPVIAAIDGFLAGERSAG